MILDVWMWDVRCGMCGCEMWDVECERWDGYGIGNMTGMVK
jgi:hypothetical protein